MGARALAAAVVVAALGLASSAHAGAQSSDTSTTNLGRGCTSKFRLLPYLSHVTATGIRINMIPEDSFDLRASISLASQSAWGAAPIATPIVEQLAVTADTRTHIVAAPNPTFTGLTAGTQYKYQVECRTSATAPYQVVNRAYFKTLQTSAGATVRIGFTADSHAYESWLGSTCALSGTPTDDSLRPMLQTVSNMGAYDARLDFIVDGGDGPSVHCLGCSVNCTWPREDGTTTATSAGSSPTQADANMRWEIFTKFYQPVLAYVPIFLTMGNHEAITGWGDDAACGGHGTNLATRGLNAYQNTFGNYNDAYPNSTSSVDYDGDGSLETQEDGLYYEFASGSFRMFMTDNLRYSAEKSTAGAVPATEFAGFAARVNDNNAPVFPNFAAATWPRNNTDTFEDDSSMGSTPTAWLVARAAAKAEAFGGIISHRIVGGIPASPACYYYQRGLIPTQIGVSGRRTVTDAWDADGDGDVADEKYIDDLMTARAIQMRFVAHDHTHVICRKNSHHYVEIGRMSCGLPPGGNCMANWLDGTNQLPANILDLKDIYDCNEDGFVDSNPTGAIVSAFDNPVANNGMVGTATNGTDLPGFGRLTVNGNTTMTWEWIESDVQTPSRNGRTVITYGPITP